MNTRTKEYTPLDVQPDAADPRDRYASQKVCISPEGEHFYGCWFPPEINPNVSDLLLQIPTGKRADWSMLSYQFYGTTRLDWLLHESSKFMDGVPSYMMDSLPAGVTIVIPDKSVVSKLIAGLL